MDTHTQTNDDLLFFVKHISSIQNDTEYQKDGVIFVKRKIANEMPQLDCVVSWKQTLFLNLVVQLSCTLTVSVCKREAIGESSKQNSSKTISLNNLDKNREGEELTDVSKIHKSENNEYFKKITSHQSYESDSSSKKTKDAKSKMVALQRITKKGFFKKF